MDEPDCSFAGYDIYRLLSFKFHEIMVIFNYDLVQLPTARSKGWLNNFALNLNYSSPFKLQARVINPITSLRKQLTLFRAKIEVALDKVFYKDLSREWIIEYFDFVTESLDEMERQAQGLMARRVWPRRPIT